MCEATACSGTVSRVNCENYACSVEATPSVHRCPCVSIVPSHSREGGVNKGDPGRVRKSPTGAAVASIVAWEQSHRSSVLPGLMSMTTISKLKGALTSRNLLAVVVGSSTSFHFFFFFFLWVREAAIISPFSSLFPFIPMISALPDPSDPSSDRPPIPPTPSPAPLDPCFVLWTLSL